MGKQMRLKTDEFQILKNICAIRRMKLRLEVTKGYMQRAGTVTCICITMIILAEMGEKAIRKDKITELHY